MEKDEIDVFLPEAVASQHRFRRAIDQSQVDDFHPWAGQSAGDTLHVRLQAVL